MKRICALMLLFVTFGVNCSVLAQDNWVFTAPAQQSVNMYDINYTNNGVSTEDAYTGRVDTSVYTNTYSNYGNSNNYTTVTPSNTYNPPPITVQPVAVTPTYETQLKTTEAEPKKTFSENHPVIAGAGLGVALLGLGALVWLLSDDDKNKKKHENCNSSSSCHHHHHHTCSSCSR